MQGIGHISKSNNPKESLLSQLMLPIILGMIMGLLVFNFMHALSCENADEHDESEYFVQALDRRLKMAEMESMGNDAIFRRITKTLGKRPIALDEAEIEAIFDQAESEAVQDALKMQFVLPIPFPDIYTVEGQQEQNTLYDDALGGTQSENNNGNGNDNGANNGFTPEWMKGLIDGKESRVEGGEQDDYYSVVQQEEKMAGQSKDSLDKVDDNDDDNDRIDTSESRIDNNSNLLTDAEKTKQCARWLLEHSVVIGKSWGTLTNSLKHQWVLMHCDYHLQKENYAQNLESVSVSESGHGHGDKGPTQLPSSSIVQKKK